ncbi:MAG: type 1 glutamine amidotransferase [Dehalococcoidia bacterium]
MSKVLVLQHTEYETLGGMSKTLKQGGIDSHHVLPFVGQPVPKEMGDAAGLIVLGGPMGVYEQAEYPHLTAEIRLIEKALYEGKPVFGICLGSQLLASALGANVRKGQGMEIGWGRIKLSEETSEDSLLQAAPDSFMAFHWHGDIFDLPKGAVPLASSAETEHQAFRYGDEAYGFLFHMEVTSEIIRALVATSPGDIKAAGITSYDIIEGMGQYLPNLQQYVGRPVFEKWAALLGEKPSAKTAVMSSQHRR